MNPEQIRARLAEIAKELEDIQAVDGSYSQEQLDLVNKLNEEFEGMTTQLEAAEKVESMKAKASASAGRKTDPNPPAGVKNRVEITRHENERFGGFKSSGDFLTAVRDFEVSGKIAPQFQSTAYEKNGEDGGFLIPADIAEGIVTKLESRESLLGSCTEFTIGGNSLTLNVDEAQPWNSGIVAYWMAEGVPYTGSKPAFKQVDFKLKKLGALVTCTDELLDDAVALESYIKNAAPAAIMHKINGSIINGNGVGKPNGILGSGMTITAAAVGGQTADTVVAKNIIAMWPRLFSAARANSAWYINPAVEEQLLGMKDDNDNYIYLAPGSQMNQSPYATLMGRPVFPMLSAMPALGDVGDILLADLSYYYAARKAGIKSSDSIHLYFDKDITAYKFSMRIDGRVPFQTPVTSEFGNYTQSAFVTLAAR